MEDFNHCESFIFDLDGTLAESKSPVDSKMANLLCRLLKNRVVGVVTGGKWLQVKKQLINHLKDDTFLRFLYVFANSGGLAMINLNGHWVKVYDYSLSNQEERAIAHDLQEAVKMCGLKFNRLWGPQIEFRGAQVTWSGLGQYAPLKEKQNWDVGGAKRMRIVDNLGELATKYEIRVNATSSIDITKKGVNKALAVRNFFTYSMVNPMASVFVGDGLYPGGNDEVVKETGVRTVQVCSVNETKALISNALK